MIQDPDLYLRIAFIPIYSGSITLAILRVGNLARWRSCAMASLPQPLHLSSLVADQDTFHITFLPIQVC